jgi:hypothetical protein
MQDVQVRMQDLKLESTCYVRKQDVFFALIPFQRHSVRFVDDWTSVGVFK